MTLIDDIKRDREAGTPGPWRVGLVDDTRVEARDGSEVAQIDGDYNHPETWPKMEANARRIARVPEMEARVLSDAEALKAADELADAVKIEWDARAKWEETPTDRGGAHGPKGRALIAWQAARAELHVALTAYRKARETRND